MHSTKTIVLKQGLFSMEVGPRMLKDCLLEDSNSCSSDGFKSFPRQPDKPNLYKPVAESKQTPKKKPQGLLKTRSKALQAVINAVKRLRCTTVKSPSILSRSFSRTLPKRDLPFSRRDKKETQVKVAIRVKDIVRWTSSRDLTENKSSLLDFEPSPPHHTTTTTTTACSSSSTPRSSNCSSWCDSDFNSEFLPSWGSTSEEYGETESRSSKKFLPGVGEDCMETTAALAAEKEVGHKECLACNGENDNYSPLCVLDVHQSERDDEESVSSLRQSLANMERAKQKLMQKNKRFESLAKIDPVNLEKRMSKEEDSEGESEGEDDDGEENFGEERSETEKKEKQLWKQVKETCAIWSCKEHSFEEPLVMDFFRDELLIRARSRHGNNGDQEFESELVAQANAWICGVKGSGIEWGSIEQKREDCVGDMERTVGKWKGFREEQGEVIKEIENGLLGILLDETVEDLRF